MGRISRDQGKTWSREDQLIVDKEGDMNVMSGVILLRLKNGNIALFYARKNSLDDCIPQIRISKNEGKDWSEPNSCIKDREGYFVLNNDRVLQLENGRLLMPVSLHKTSNSEWSHKGELRCCYSDDQGKSWHSGDMVPSPGLTITQEPGVVELKSGKIMMIIRASGGRQYHSISEDQGLSWSYAKPTDIASPISPAWLERLPSTAIFYWSGIIMEKQVRDIHKAKRSPFYVGNTQDDGKSWQHQQKHRNRFRGHVLLYRDSGYRRFCFAGISIKARER